jgi:2'-5' RNA ligase
VVTARAAGNMTVGVALPVPDPWGTSLQRLRLAFGEERAALIPTHITLLPPTPATEEQVAALHEHLEELSATFPPFRVVLRGTGSFRPVSEVVFIQVAQGVAPCEQLESAVRAGPVDRDLVFPYHPHVTVAHDLPTGVLDRAFTELADFAADFVATHVTLYVHHGDEAWEPVADFHLRGPAAPEYLPD